MEESDNQSEKSLILTAFVLLVMITALPSGCAVAITAIVGKVTINISVK